MPRPSYIRSIADKLNINPEALYNLDQPVSYLDPQPAARRVPAQRKEINLRLDHLRLLSNISQHACLGSRHHSHGHSSHQHALLARPIRVKQGINAEMPSTEAIERYRRLFATGEKVDNTPSQPKAKKQSKSRQTLPGLRPACRHPRQGCQNPERFLRPGDPSPDPRTLLHLSLRSGKAHAKNIRTNAQHIRARTGCNTKLESAALRHAAIVLPLPPVPQIDQGRAIGISSPNSSSGCHIEGARMNWRMLVEVETNTILYLRALSSGVNGSSSPTIRSPAQGTATNTPNQTMPCSTRIETMSCSPTSIAPVAGNSIIAGNIGQR